MTNPNIPDFLTKYAPSTIQELLAECAKKGPLLPPMNECKQHGDGGPTKAKRVNLGTMHVAKVHKDDNSVAGRPDLQEAVRLVRSRAGRLQFPVLTEEMVSGYGGHIPKNVFQLGKTYREMCIKSIAEMELEDQAAGKAPEEEECKPIAGKDSKKNKMAEGQGYVRASNINPNDFVSPYKMANDDPEKYYKSGYGGFVPRTQNKFGTNVEMTHIALNEFTDFMKKFDKKHNPCD